LGTQKVKSKKVELGTESNDVGLAADPKYPISRLSKLVVGKKRKNLTSKKESEEGRETDQQ
jgi:hypothetical protein